MGAFFLPSEAKCTSVKWIYKTKLNQHDEAIKYKTRFVAKGHSHEHGIDYTEVYTRVARMDTIMTILATKAQKAWDIHQTDMESAFLHGILPEDIYIQQQKRYIVDRQEDNIYKLHKTLYGIKQTPRACLVALESTFLVSFMKY